MGCAMGIRLLAGARDFSLSKTVQSVPRAQPAFYSMDTSVFFSPGVKQQSHEDDLSPPCNAKVKNEWMYTSPPLYAFMVWTRTILPLVY